MDVTRVWGEEVVLAAGSESLPPRGLGFGDERICIAVLDGPVDLDHPCFDGAKLTVVGEGHADGPALAHGTHVASIIFGQPASEVQGIAPSCRGLIVPIFGMGTGGALNCSQLDLARAILMAVSNGAHIINISGGELSSSGEPYPLLGKALAACVDRNVLVVAAAGNDGCACLHIPAASPSVLAVGAMDGDGRPLPSSNWGDAYRSQGVLAPGADVLGAAPGGGTRRLSGTSFAAPYVSGHAALLASLQVSRGAAPDPHAIRAAILASAEPCVPDATQDCQTFLAGRLNIVGALANIIIGGDEAMPDTLAPSLPVTSPEAAGRAEAESGRTGDPETSSTPPGNSATKAFARIAPSECACGGGSDCTCGGGLQQTQLVYALGRIGHDFGSEARRDSFFQAMNGVLMPGPGEAPIENLKYPNIARHWLDHLKETGKAPDAAAVIWTLLVDVTPVYAIQPAGPFAAAGYDLLREFLEDQVTSQGDRVELVSIPGVINGNVRLESGQIVPVIIPAIRGMYSWSTKALVREAFGKLQIVPTAKDATDLADFLNRIYYDLRNLGITPEDRALNFSATQAVQIAQVVNSATRENLDLDTITVKKSPVCRPGSDCYDVEVQFYNPDNMSIGNRIYRFTVDVSDVMPVTVGAVRNWTRRV